MEKQHSYSINVKWTGNLGNGTASYNGYKRTHEISAAGKQIIPMSSDPGFRGDADRYNPEELLVAALSTCHMLWYLHLCAVAKIVVESYEDAASGTMAETADGGGHFTEVVLHPRVVVRSGANLNHAKELHHEAHRLCFIASSVNFAVRCEAEMITATRPSS